MAANTKSTSANSGASTETTERSDAPHDARSLLYDLVVACRSYDSTKPAHVQEYSSALDAAEAFLQTPRSETFAIEGGAPGTTSVYSESKAQRCVVVPRHPTAKMLDAGMDLLDENFQLRGDGHLEQVYTAMLAAAPVAATPKTAKCRCPVGFSLRCPVHGQPLPERNGE